MIIQTETYPILFNELGFQHIIDLIETKKHSNYFILVDENTHEHCLSEFLSLVPNLKDFEILEVPAGEQAKSFEICGVLWESLMELKANRNTLIFNLGGGVVTDLGGFVASTFKRGVDFINIPTTLLSMVDASVGGKTGINFAGLKNQIGAFANPIAILVYPAFIETLPQRELSSGYAEMFKHGLISDAKLWDRLKDYSNLEFTTLTQLIYDSIGIKHQVVKIDPKEKGLRKTLNFGHTIGHAIESHYAKTEKPFTHGEAIGLGMIAEAYISMKLNHLDETKYLEIKNILNDFYQNLSIEKNIDSLLIDLMKGDKKNEKKGINFSLLNTIGKCDFNFDITEEQIILEALEQIK